MNHKPQCYCLFILPLVGELEYKRKTALDFRAEKTRVATGLLGNPKREASLGAIAAWRAGLRPPLPPLIPETTVFLCRSH